MKLHGDRPAFAPGLDRVHQPHQVEVCGGAVGFLLVGLNPQNHALDLELFAG